MVLILIHCVVVSGYWLGEDNGFGTGKGLVDKLLGSNIDSNVKDLRFMSTLKHF